MHFQTRVEWSISVVFMGLSRLLAECTKSTRRVPDLLLDMVLRRDLLAESTILLAEYSANFQIPEVALGTFTATFIFWEELFLEMF